MRAYEILNELSLPLGKPTSIGDLTFGFEVELFMTTDFCIRNRNTDDDDDQTRTYDLNDAQSPDDIDEYYYFYPSDVRNAVREWGKENGIEDRDPEGFFKAVGVDAYLTAIDAKLYDQYVREGDLIFSTPSFSDAAYTFRDVVSDRVGIYDIDIAHSSDEGIEDKDFDNTWYLEPDGSLRPNSEWDYGIELTSPILTHENFKDYLSSVLDLIKDTDGLYTNGTSGLHVNIGVPEGIEKLDRVKLLAFAGEAWLGKLFKRAGQNEMISSLMNKIASEVTFDKNFDKLIAALNHLLDDLNDKTFAINPLPINEHGYIEFRAIGGKDYENRQDEVFKHVDRYVRLIRIASNPSVGRQEYMKKVYAFVKGRAAPSAKMMSPELKIVRDWIIKLGPGNVEKLMPDGVLNLSPRMLFSGLVSSYERNIPVSPLLLRTLLRLVPVTDEDREKFEQARRYHENDPVELAAYDAALADVT
jgi:hypothetical protein